MLGQTPDKAPTQLSSVKENYDHSKASTDKVLKESEKPLDPKDAGETKSEIPVDGDDLKQGYNKVQTIYSLGGLNSLAIAGNEGFMDTVKDSVIWVIRRASDILEWLIEFCFNRIATIRRRITRLKRIYHANGLRLSDTKYPRSVVRLTSNVNVPKSPEFALKGLDDAQKVYRKVMEAQKTITRMTRSLPGDVSREQCLNLAEGLTVDYMKQIGDSKLDNNVYEVQLPTGFYRMKAVVNRSRGFNGMSLSNYVKSGVRIHIPESFTPNADIIQRLILKMDVYLMDIEEAHRSQRSFANNFKKSVHPLMDAGKGFDPESRKEALKYYRWLINFQHKSITLPLNYYLGVLSAAVDLASAQVRSGETNKE